MTARFRIVASIAVLAAGCIAPPSGSTVGGRTDAGSSDVGSGERDASVPWDAGSDRVDGIPDAIPDAGGDGGATDTGVSDLGADSGVADMGPITECPVNVPFLPDFPFSHTLWVDAAASADLVGDGTEQTPFSTLQQATDAATPGTVIRVRAGTYAAGAFITNFDDGTPQMPYGIVGEQGTVLSGIDGSAIQLKSPSWVLLENLRIENVTTGHGLNIDDSGIEDSAHHVVIRNVDIDTVGIPGSVSRCVRLTRVNDFIVEGSSMSACAYGGVEVIGAQRGRVSDTLFERTDRRGLSVESGSRDVLIHGNKFQNVEGRNVHVGGGGSLAHSSATYAAENVRVVANLFVQNEPGEAPIVDADCLGCVYANNAIWRPPGTVFRMLRENRASPVSEDITFVNNNITMATEPSNVLQFGLDVGPGGYTFGHNNWWVENDANYSGPDHGQAIHLGNDSYVDPLWDGFFGRIAEQSPMIAAGKTGVVDGLPDSFGNCFQAPPTIGNHEAR